MWENKLRSLVSIKSSISKSVHETPRRWVFRDMAPMRFLSSAVEKLASEGWQCVGDFRHMIRPVNRVCNAWTFMPCDFNWDNKYRRWFICTSILLTYTEVERLEVISVASKVTSVNRSIPSKGRGILRCLEAGRYTNRTVRCLKTLYPYWSTDNELINNRLALNFDILNQE